jgi:hypothetical protein
LTRSVKACNAARERTQSAFSPGVTAGASSYPEVAMFALFAFVCFLLAFIFKLVGFATGHFDLVILGFCFIALQLMFGWGFDRFRRTG